MNDFNNLSIRERFFLIEASYGRAMLRAHGLERMLATLLICKLTLSQGPKDQHDTQIAKIKRQPMGNLIAQFVAEFSPPTELREGLNHLLSLRNDLAHRISETIIDSTVNEGWQTQIMRELSDIGDQFARFRPNMLPYLQRFQEQMKLSDEKILSIIQRDHPGAGIDISKAAS